jgi:hypothetical protein
VSAPKPVKEVIVVHKNDARIVIVVMFAKGPNVEPEVSDNGWDFTETFSGQYRGSYGAKPPPGPGIWVGEMSPRWDSSEDPDIDYSSCVWRRLTTGEFAKLSVGLHDLLFPDIVSAADYSKNERKEE